MFRKTRERLLEFDPGYVNLVTALRGTLGVVISFFILSSLAKRFGQSPMIPFLGVLLTMNASIFVRDPEKRQQQITILAIPIPACLGLLASVLLARWPEARMVGLLTVIFFAVLVRRAGNRWVGLGVISFLAYFLPLFIPVSLEALPFAVGSIVVAVFISYLIRFVLLPDRPEMTLRHYLDAFEMRKVDVIRKLETKFLDPTRGPREVDAALTSLNELSLMIEQFLKAAGARAFKSPSENLRMRVFERELALRQLAQEVDEWIDAAKATGTRAHPSDFQLKVSSLAGHIRASPGTLEEIVDELQETRRTKRAVRERGLHLTTRQAIQATLATAIASGAGFLISPPRWYWAALASFFVFIGTSRGETLMRAMYRVVGTGAGLAIGFACANLISGHHGLEWALIVACVFLGIFGSKLTFGFWTAGLFTIMIAILFDVLGQLTNQLLFLRMEETVIGAIVGAIIGSFVLPTSTRATVQRALAQLLRTVADVLSELPLERASSKRNFVARLREMDYDLQGLRLAAAPVAGSLTLMKRGGIPQLLHDAAILVHYVLHFATMNSEFEDRETLRSRCQALAGELSRAANAIESGRTETLPKVKAEPSERGGSLIHPAYVLDRIGQISGALLARKP